MQTTNKHKTVGFLLVLCALFSLFLLFCACGGSRHSNDAKDSNSLAEIANGELERYTIVRGDNSGNGVLKAALNLRAAIRQRGGGTLTLSTDFSESAPLEILLGPTNRPESLQVQKELDSATQYIIRSVGDKIVLYAATQNNLYAAVERFVSDCISRNSTLTNINIVQKNEGLTLCTKDHPCTFVVPDNASDEFVNCAKKMLETLDIPNTKIVNYKNFEGGAAVMLGIMSNDTISTAYAEFLNENEYIARSAAEKIYLMGTNDLLTLTALGDFLFDLQNHLDRDWEGNRCVCAPAAYSFNSTWDLYVPKPVQANLENSESISSNTHLFYYTDVTEYSLSLFTHMLGFLGYAPVPYEESTYKEGVNIITFTFSAEDGTLSVTVTIEQPQTDS